MRIVICGLTVSSSWGNGHATLWRALLKAMARRGHRILFYERDMPYYAGSRDMWQPPAGAELRIYDDLAGTLPGMRREFDAADVAISTSYCPDGALLCQMILASRAGRKLFYDLDTPVTFDRLHAGAAIEYLPPEGLAGFDLVLSYTGGPALQELKERLGARTVAPLYGFFDPEVHFPAAAMPEFRGEFSYLGTYAADRQPALEELFLRPAARLPERRFVIGGAQYPQSFPWGENIYFVRHLPPSLHPAFFRSARATLNITRRAMAEYGFCPSGRLFEAAGCAAPVVSDCWHGLEEFFIPGKEILPVNTTEDTLAALSLSDAELGRIGRAARERAFAEHTADHRVLEFERLCEDPPAAGSLPVRKFADDLPA